jgi:hypothetical protein
MQRDSHTQVESLDERAAGSGRRGPSVRWRPAHGLRQASGFYSTVGERCRGLSAATAAKDPVRHCVALAHGVNARLLPNPAVERTHNGGAPWSVNPSSAAPLCAAHGER